MPPARQSSLRRRHDNADLVLATRVDTVVGPLSMPVDCTTITPALAQTGVWEPEESIALQALLRPGMRFLDVGAHCGYHSVLAARMVGVDGQVVSVEAHATNHALLVDNLSRLAPCDWATLNVAAWLSDDGPVVMEGWEGNSGSFRVYPSSRATAQGPTVERRRLDRAVAEVADRDWRPDVIKIDVEGAEPAALEGMGALLDTRPVLLAEFQPMAIEVSGEDPVDTLERLRGHGYTIRALGVCDWPHDVDAETIVADARQRPSGYSSLLCMPARRD